MKRLFIAAFLLFLVACSGEPVEVTRIVTEQVEVEVVTEVTRVVTEEVEVTRIVEVEVEVPVEVTRIVEVEVTDGPTDTYSL